jgi:hypothetical protein
MYPKLTAALRQYFFGDWLESLFLDKKASRQLEENYNSYVWMCKVIKKAFK